ncbi:MAG TPA: anaerobic glycerol-3-phosphate dehydrogenase subunit C [Ornithinibacter sp.]|nr:anaerobic glycerol-3-phosphate dehydrogenase subunit C [Ornithinibacter sp.]HQA14008.1 anaerobic glycerol-3-phosphate dehydrogenase subunit C [Ornithinibacter sp.]HQD68168.1 anaerobic glycerol-3-phosphate dehydrogenase subunit C [Ornithinibacter sp.]
MSESNAKKLRERLNNELKRASLDACVKCTICEQSCPVSAVTPLFSGPKFVGPQAERFRDGASVDHSVDYCSSCGTCSVVCPQGVKVAELNSLARAVLKAEHGVPVRDRLITQTTLMGKAMTPVAPIANAVLGNSAARKAMELVMGVAASAPMPTAHGQTLRGWLKKRPAPTKAPTRGQVVFFHGCAGGYFETEAAKCAVEVLEFLGFEVLVPEQGCCGLAEQSNGLFEQASSSVRALVGQLRKPGVGVPIVSTAGSCGGMLKHEAHEILGLDDPDLLDVGRRTRDISEFLMELHDAGDLPTDFAPIAARVPYHQPCQVRSQGIGMPAADLLRLIPKLEVVESGAICCGIAGTYGLKKEKYEIAQAVGKPLFDMVLETNQGVAACDTETCRWQIAKSTGVKTIHPIQLVHQAYGLGRVEGL